jgi:hypothetical protein
MFTQFTQKFKSFISRHFKPALKFIFIIGVLAGAWVGFLYLVDKPPIDTTPALVMVWISAIILLIAVFPKIFDKIKRLKVKDFEIELQETVKRTSEEDFISMDELDDYVFSQKGSFRNLTDILRQAKRNPKKPILLTANLRDGRYISTPMLFVYLFFLDLIGSSVMVLFVSSRNSLRSLKDISRKKILGLTSGKTALRIFYDRFPHFYRIFDVSRNSNVSFEEMFRRGKLPDGIDDHLFHRCYEMLREHRLEESEYLTEDDVLTWFSDQLNIKAVDLDATDSTIIKRAIENGDEFVIILKDNTLRSVIALCKITKNISAKVFDNIM